MPPARVGLLFAGALGAACGPAREDSPHAGGNGGSSSGTAPPSLTATTNPNTTTGEPFGTASGSTGDDCDFICDLDVPSPVECNTWDDDCPEGEKCSAWANDGGNAWNATRCVPLARDPAAPGERCTVQGSGVSGIDSCDVGSMCWDVTPEGEGTCVSFCMGDPVDPECDPTSRCVFSGRGTLALCLPQCNPLDPTSCDKDLGCYPTHDDALTCGVPDDSREAFETCQIHNDCTPGNLCVPSANVGACLDPAADRCCTPWCDLQAPDCPGATVCDPFLTPFENVGVCRQAS